MSKVWAQNFAVSNRSLSKNNVLQNTNGIYIRSLNFIKPVKKKKPLIGDEKSKINGNMKQLEIVLFLR